MAFLKRLSSPRGLQPALATRTRGLSCGKPRGAESLGEDTSEARLDFAILDSAEPAPNRGRIPVKTPRCLAPRPPWLLRP